MSRESDSVAPSIEQPIRTHAILHSLSSLVYLYNGNSIGKIDFRAHVYNKVYLLTSVPLKFGTVKNL